MTAGFNGKNIRSGSPTQWYAGAGLYQLRESVKFGGFCKPIEKII